MTDDQKRLAEYCRNGSEKAFRELVEQYAGLVYSAAMRMVNGDTHLAQDIAQVVFSNLANKARSLPGNVILAGWLHRDTRYTALEWLRRERRRLHREKEAAIIHEIPLANQELDWPSLRPVLDEALDELEDQDRHILLLRFFEQRKLSEVGTALGLAEDTARKRVARALDKLRKGLTARGVTTTTAALCLVLSTRGVEPIPAELTRQITHTALAATGATTGSFFATLAFMTTAKSISIASAIILVLFLGGSKIYRSMSKAASTQSEHPESETKARVESDQARLAARTARPQSSANPTGTDALSAALARIRQALEDPSRRFSNPALEEAINALGDQRKAAVPLLREELQSPREQVRTRAAAGLGMVGTDAREAAPDLVQMLRDSTSSGTAMQSANALLRIGPLPEMLGDLTTILRENSSTRLTIANTISEITHADTTQLDSAMRPLLGDTDVEVRQTAAYVLAMTLRDHAGVEVLQATKSGLESADEDVRGLALSALKNIGSDPKDLTGRVTTEKLGAAAADLVPALVQIANNNGRKDQQHQALELLDAIQPGLRASYTPMDALLTSREQDSAFALQVRANDLPLPELIRGVQDHPGAVGATAEALGRLGPAAQAALPSLQLALNSLEPQPDASFGDLVQALRTRSAVANAIQKIAPDEPKVLFTQEDMASVLNALEDPLAQADSTRRKQIATALQAALAEGPTNRVERTPDQMRRVVESLAGVDPAYSDAMLKQLKKIDPHFAARK